MEEVKIFDSTLRDGAQSESISFTVEDKLNIVDALDKLGIAYIEAGNPGSNPKDLEFFEKVKKKKLQYARLVAFGSTRRRNIKVEEDNNVIALLQAETPAVAIFGKSWDFHVTDIIRTTLEENLQMVEDTLRFFLDKGKEVIFDAEHFFDGYKNNPAYALSVLKRAEQVGVHSIALCDTNGGCFPDEIFDITKIVRETVRCEIGIHCHNDVGCAVANSIFAVNAGARQVQGTYIGFGERTGNANLSSVIPALQLKKNYVCIPPGNMVMLTETARKIADISNSILPNNTPFVGKSAFAHKGGMHVDGVRKSAISFEHIPPETVGNKRNVLISEVAGRTAMLSKISQFDPTLEKDSPKTQELIDLLKQLEFDGYQYEAAMASFELVVLKQLGKFKPFFNVEEFKVIGEKTAGSKKNVSSAIVKVKVEEAIAITADEGEGPVHALDIALRKALRHFYPALDTVKLIDYKVRVLDPKGAAAAKVRVLVETTDGSTVWTTVGVSTDIINASLHAIIDSIEYKLLKDTH